MDINVHGTAQNPLNLPATFCIAILTDIITVISAQQTRNPLNSISPSGSSMLCKTDVPQYSLDNTSNFPASRPLQSFSQSSSLGAHPAHKSFQLCVLPVVVLQDFPYLIVFTEQSLHPFSLRRLDWDLTLSAGYAPTSAGLLDGVKSF